MADPGNRRGAAGAHAVGVRALILTSDGEIHAVFLVPEGAMDEEGMYEVHEIAAHYGQHVRNLITTPLGNLPKVGSFIKSLNQE